LGVGSDGGRRHARRWYETAFGLCVRGVLRCRPLFRWLGTFAVGMLVRLMHHESPSIATAIGANGAALTPSRPAATIPRDGIAPYGIAPLLRATRERKPVQVRYGPVDAGVSHPAVARRRGFARLRDHPGCRGAH